ncbi:3-oxoacyl-ACP synthase III family protein [Aureibacter tunicatorum]|uniref:Beta-ketoacyl-[acyl-carrier-protein] synthase III n=1 Tax=Aureibacter tunicatorum TaxID=866807 RepID=A0AAE3XN28_9BACT|nr:beta-ketoacyl-ACP synthase III [Aureibacter tunicatorum]MDR6239613.1 3-oxoacyl-[acyl-carrier-protein] synthase-3 [Aureibacter tunicatorum]BDD04090.1 3-oxoacyl-[acyl-carrier-protein] synthase 3 [Aureibacter tunicatorum]
MHASKIVGVGHYVPDRVVTNHDLEKLMNTSDEWIQERTGIKERRYITPGKDTVSSMAKEATLMALERAGMAKEEIDMIILATITPDYYFPGSGVLLQRDLELEAIPALDIRNACSGFIYGLSVADQFVKTGMYRNVLVIGAEIQSTGLELNDEGRNVAVIFGDGAGAAIVQRAEGDEGILSTHLHSDGRFAEELYVKDPGSSRPPRLTPELIKGPTTKPFMNGSAVFKHAVVRFMEVIGEALNANGYEKDDIDLLIPHQANLRISQYIQTKLGLPPEKVFNNIMKYGNTTAASIPIAMSEAFEEGRLKRGDLLCLAAFGSGFTWASALIRW